ncbi:hypothetical protein EYC84_009644 [Monilinia fructicola]|uniref:Transcription factor PAP1 domain-containing protein n=1 Tax=Monilinia fructicola TaxID=38448 RepID=A0A5M9JDB6_MONFR|nr:hypothetical protein EYC84_009644 [Monilinia fructicola]
MEVQPSSRNQSNASNTFGIGLSQNPARIGGDDMSSFSGLFAPELMDNASKTAFEQFGHGTTNGSMSSTDSPNISTATSTRHQEIMKPPFSMSTELIGLLNKTTISFDPQLFGDYREPQNNVLSNDAFALDDGFFADAFDMPDFNSPFNVPSPMATKKDLVQQIDEKQNEDDEVVPAEDRSTMLSCNTIWDRLQKCPKVKEGDFDLDNLCKDLQKKAKCSETGAVVNESDFQNIMKNYIPKGSDFSNSAAKRA